MNPDPEKRRVLLDDLLSPSGEDTGPSRTDMLQMLRSERQRRHRRRTGAAFLAVFAVGITSLFWIGKPVAAPRVGLAWVGPAPIVIHQVNDEQLMALLEGTPSALMELPDGKRTLFFVEQSSAR